MSPQVSNTSNTRAYLEKRHTVFILTYDINGYQLHFIRHYMTFIIFCMPEKEKGTEIQHLFFYREYFRWNYSTDVAALYIDFT